VCALTTSSLTALEIERYPSDKNESVCACGWLCGGRRRRDDTPCSEAVPSCANSMPRASSFGMAVQAFNPVYRIKDTLFNLGETWRIDSMIILCESRYRGTLLRQALVRMLSVDGEPGRLSRLSDSAVEKFIATRGDDGRPGHFRMLGFGPFGSGVSLTKFLMPGFVMRLRDLQATGACSEAEADELVVVIRLGDEIQKPRELVHVVRRYLAAHPCEVARAEVSGTINFASNSPLFRYNDSVVQMSLAAVDELVALLRREGLPTRVRSEPVADRDICHYIFSDHVIGALTGRGFYSTASMIRERHKFGSGWTIAAVNRSLERPRLAGSAACRGARKPAAIQCMDRDPSCPHWVRLANCSFHLNPAMPLRKFCCESCARLGHAARG
jgi:hypothetical protein